MRRNVTTDTEIGGQKIKKGEKVVMYYGAANRDPAVFENPDTFDIRRSPNPHLTFGGGRHDCLGFHMARLEFTTMFGTILRRMPDMELAGPVVYKRHFETPQVLGPYNVPIRFTPGPRVVSESVERVFA